ncbi:universal stress protein [Rhodobacter calidifons]|uniref:Universal stress protein n=1 Tax=Rhodobacter calidifons TaxID=2715277 RepID=A0ABX0G7L7_9RHOB|nr:universal stress protein [Rhodobacter calidifons]NHB77201.1 universal stress protein [Rhodobacter calidifons]
MPERLASIPLSTYPEPVPDAAILASLDLARVLGCRAEVTAYAVQIPPVAAPLGNFLVNVEAMARTAEERSLAECDRIAALVATRGAGTDAIGFSRRQAQPGVMTELATRAARYADLAVVAWAPDMLAAQDMAQALIFGAGVPVILMPPTASPDRLDHIAVAWDESRVAARALGDALRLLAPGGRVSVLTVRDEKALSGADIADRLAATLGARGYSAAPVSLTLDGRSIGVALQEAALAAGAQLMAMGGFGHSRLRDFILGGATTDILAELRLPALLAH